MGRLVFAFGTHGNEKAPPNRAFFREAISPFIEEIGRSGRHGIIIHEATVPLEMDLPQFRKLIVRLSGEGALRRISRLQSEIREKTSEGIANLRCTADMGRPSHYPEFDIGFEDALRSVNSKRPGAILNIIEPQHVHTTLAVLHDDLASGGNFLLTNGIGHMLEALDVRVKNIVFRDAMMIRLFGQLLLNYPEYAIIVPRGTAHSHLSGLAERYLSLGPGSIEASIENEYPGWDPGLDLVTSQAVEKAFLGRLDRRELVFFCLKWMYFIDQALEGKPLDRLNLKAADIEAGFFARQSLDEVMEKLFAFKG